MPSRKETMRAHKRLQLAAPTCDDASLMESKEEVAEFLREAKRQDEFAPEETASTVVDEVARKYFRHILRQQARVTLVLCRRSV
jgi:hypothetical protein